MKATPTEQKELLRLQAIDTRVQQLTHLLANLPGFWELKRTRTEGPDFSTVPASALEITRAQG